VLFRSTLFFPPEVNDVRGRICPIKAIHLNPVEAD
jgi:hypothetical protein